MLTPMIHPLDGGLGQLAKNFLPLFVIQKQMACWFAQDRGSFTPFLGATWLKRPQAGICSRFVGVALNSVMLLLVQPCLMSYLCPRWSGKLSWFLIFEYLCKYIWVNSSSFGPIRREVDTDLGSHNFGTGLNYGRFTFSIVRCHIVFYMHKMDC